MVQEATAKKHRQNYSLENLPKSIHHCCVFAIVHFRFWFDAFVDNYVFRDWFIPLH